MIRKMVEALSQGILQVSVVGTIGRNWVEEAVGEAWEEEEYQEGTLLGE